jgi:hypothetical protein
MSRQPSGRLGPTQKLRAFPLQRIQQILADRFFKVLHGIQVPQGRSGVSLEKLLELLFESSRPKSVLGQIASNDRRIFLAREEDLFPFGWKPRPIRFGLANVSPVVPHPENKARGAAELGYFEVHGFVPFFFYTIRAIIFRKCI